MDYSTARKSKEPDSFSSSRQSFNELLDSLNSGVTSDMNHSDLERFLQTEGRELLRKLFEEKLRFRGDGNIGEVVQGSDGVDRLYKRESARNLKSVFGDVSVERLGYGKPGEASLFPKDLDLNLPTEIYSHGISRLMSLNASKGSFDEAIATVEEATGVDVPKRQALALVKNAAQDFESFYEQNEPDMPTKRGDFVVVTMDAKGIVMRKESLTEDTRKRADESKTKLTKRLSKGEKANRKRMATVASVYEIDPFKRTPEQVCSDLRPVRDAVEKKRPRPQNKRVWASVERSPEVVTAEVFEHASKLDPGSEKTWLALVDGEPNQILRIEKEAKARSVDITIILDIIHVIEYLWKASRVFNEETSKEAQDWVTERLIEILRGNSSHVAAGIRRSATLRDLDEDDREPVDKCADYLLNKSAYLKYDKYLERGFPIATGVIEGACRYLIKDRLDITGARWSLDGAEAVLKLRSLRTSGDFEQYWIYHENQELQRNHVAKFKNSNLPKK